MRAALGMRAALADSIESRPRTEMPELHVGFGVATVSWWPAMWAATKLEYTVIGDPVNLAARLQELTPSRASILMSAGDRSDDESGRALRYLGGTWCEGG